MNVDDQLERDEGRERVAYCDPRTKGPPWTIGVGHTGPEVHEGLEWTDDQIDAAYDHDVEEATAECNAHFLPWFPALNDARQAVLINMVFNMGIERALQFAPTFALIRDERYADAAEHLRQSAWGHELPTRVRRLAHQLETGEWQ